MLIEGGKKQLPRISAEMAEQQTYSKESEDVPAEHTITHKQGFVFPWMGIGALVLALASVAGSLAILIVANNSPQEKWVAGKPSTWLSVVTSVTNILIHIGLAEGINVLWWYRSTKDKTTLNDLHEYWIYGTSIISAAFA